MIGKREGNKRRCEEKRFAVFSFTDLVFLTASAREVSEFCSSVQFHLRGINQSLYTLWGCDEYIEISYIKEHVFFFFNFRFVLCDLSFSN